ncbi:excinuclease ABC subunit B [Ectocarpus siliculosus]|uniref:Excinuclease ABC subunit B n=1 Tax=Ectocarpus siliculosus TaxID=2880 RepID=D7FRM3_ECTSI|nr:excinuclease ABC subunit B [Ectocarpus siliculosus]|eukprot:CBJ30814.1 excinuclease ABC subunit B [Ectocarpus siliculosus]
MAGMLHRGTAFGLPRIAQRSSATLASWVKVSAAAATVQPPLVATKDTSSLLSELASRVVQGKAERAVPAGSQLKRRRAWDLYLDGSEAAAVLVVSKKSTFTLEDARTALRIISDEAAARCLNDETKHVRQLLLTTRAAVAPAADAFLQGVHANLGPPDFGETGGVAVMRWEQLQHLVQEGGLGRHLITSRSRRRGGSGDPNAPSFALPAWLVEERERGVGAVFDLNSPFEPAGDQPEAIKALCQGIEEGKRHQTLLGATGTGKTFIIANVIQEARLPTLVLAPNKVLASQLTNELRALFPNNAVEFFVSYYDYYLPEAFNSASDTYIDKVVQINDDIDRMRHSATQSLLERRDVIVVASVSCIYGLGMPSKYLEASIRIVVGQEWTGGWRALAQHLEQGLFYTPKHNQEDFEALPRGSFRSVSVEGGGGVIEIGPASDEAVVRVTLDAAGVVRRIQVVPIVRGGEARADKEKEPHRDLSDLLTAPDRGHHKREPHHDLSDLLTAQDLGHDKPLVGSERALDDVDAHVIYPAKHHVVGRGEMEDVMSKISEEMEERCSQLGLGGKILEAERLRQRTENDLLLLGAVGTCKGVENYSRHLAGRAPGDPPETLVDYFPENEWLLIVDESHVSAPQLGAMWGGDQARKKKLVEHGFRLPSALDNRPLKADEFWSKVDKTIFVSATPGKFELELATLGAGKSGGMGWDEIGDLVDAQAVIRPTGITDPPVDIRPSEGQVSDMVQECKTRGGRGERVLVTALTKQMAEDLSAFLMEQGVPTAYLHSGVKPMQRLELLRQLRSGEIDVIVGVNLLREGLNLPEVSLVCILDADAEGFLRSDTALLQTIGRATRHEAGRAVLYADRITPSMKRALAETDRRREIQTRHNKLHGITPSVAKAASVGDSILDSINGDAVHTQREGEGRDSSSDHVASWANHSLLPDQVQLLYDLAAQNGKGSAHQQKTLLTPSEGTTHALMRLAEQASTKMSLAATKTDFKEAALWRDRRDALLSTLSTIGTYQQ